MEAGGYAQGVLYLPSLIFYIFLYAGWLGYCWGVAVFPCCNLLTALFYMELI